MGKSRSLGLGLVLLVVVFSVLGLTGTALAADPVLDGPDTPAIADPVGTDVSPHGGYSAATDYCLQCHNVHAGTNPYAFLRQSSITAVCATCHGIDGGAGGTTPADATGAYDPLDGGAGPYPNGSNLNADTAAIPPSVPITNATWAGNVATISGVVPGLAVGDYVWVWGVVSTPSGQPAGSGTGYNGTWRVTGVGSIGYTFALTSNPGTYVSGGTSQKTNTTVAAQPGVGTVANPGPGTASVRVAYTTSSASAEHTLGVNSPPGLDSAVVLTEPEWSYGWRSGSNKPGRVTGGVFNYPNSTTSNAGEPAGVEGLNCASCHTPHGEYGQLINANYVWSEVEGASTIPLTGAPNKVALNASETDSGSGGDSGYDLYTVANNTIVYGYNLGTTALQSSGACASPQTGLRLGDAGYCVNAGSQGLLYLHRNTTGTPYWEVCANTTYTSCTPWKVEAQDGGFNRPDGARVSAYGYRLLSAYPNHSWKVPASWGADLRLDDQPSWCGKCHPSRVDAMFPAAWVNGVEGYSGSAGTYHNHPTPCTYCHGNPSLPQGGSNDFPHTSSNTNFLKQYPDGLCIQCHTGGLP